MSALESLFVSVPSGPEVLGRPALWAGFATALVATPLLARLARKRGWLDRPEEAGHRKLQGRPVPPVGGAAVLLGLCAAWLALRGTGGHWDPFVAAWIHPLAGAAALLLAFLAGAIDDRVPGGLAPARKLALQAAAALPVALSVLLHGSPAAPEASLLLALAALVGGVVAQNAFNTFDNADGATTSLGICALAFTAPVLAGALLGFLPFNLNARRRGGAQAAPTAYLGDSGSHLLGMLVLIVPAAWPAFALPLLDLARVSLRRLAAGSRPWIGDRRHLAHRLAAAGLGRSGVPAVLALVALPAIVLGAHGWLLAGLAGTLGLFLVSVGLTPDPDRPRG